MDSPAEQASDIGKHQAQKTRLTARSLLTVNLIIHSLLASHIRKGEPVIDLNFNLNPTPGSNRSGEVETRNLRPQSFEPTHKRTSDEKLLFYLLSEKVNCRKRHECEPAVSPWPHKERFPSAPIMLGHRRPHPRRHPVRPNGRTDGPRREKQRLDDDQHESTNRLGPALGNPRTRHIYPFVFINYFTIAPQT